MTNPTSICMGKVQKEGLKKGKYQKLYPTLNNIIYSKLLAMLAPERYTGKFCNYYQCIEPGEKRENDVSIRQMLVF